MIKALETELLSTAAENKQIRAEVLAEQHRENAVKA
jgi:hypothetical protein